jgi:hypothetical protein
LNSITDSEQTEQTAPPEVPADQQPALLPEVPADQQPALLPEVPPIEVPADQPATSCK